MNFQMTCKADDHEDKEEEFLADVAIARWWKKTGRLSCSESCLPRSENPQTIINYVSG